MESVSIIMAHWGMNDFRSETLRKCLDSLIETTKHLPVEIIIGDNGGNKEDSLYLLDLVEQKKIKHYFRNSENLYFGWVRNIGYEMSDGKYLVFSDNDILYKEGWLEKSIGILEKYPENKIFITPLRTDREHRNNRHWSGELEYNGERILLNMRAGSNSWVMRREDFPIIGKFRNHYIAGSKWNDSFVKKGYLMATMEYDQRAQDIGFKKGYNCRQEVDIFKIFSNGEKLRINT